MNEYNDINEFDNQNRCRICNINNDNVYPMSTNQVKSYQIIVVSLICNICVLFDI